MSEVGEGGPADVRTGKPSGRKRVYVLGAGFSRDAGLPLQVDILRRVRELNLMDVPPDTVQVFVDAQAALLPFLDRVFPGDPSPSLEDVFTLLDQTIAARDTCAGLTWRDLVDARDALYRAILFVLHQAWAAVPEADRAFYHGVAALLLERRILAGQPADPFGVVSLNWDYVLEDSLYWCIRQAGLERQADVDFCCYTTPLSDDVLHTPSVKQRARGMFNVKLMKLHGSANFLRCPGCNRLSTGAGSTARVWDQYVLPNRCTHCPPFPPALTERPGETESAGPLLEPFFITPTFLKTFDSAHIRMIWHNAHMDLAEADEVVFIGYSLPDADYHVRALLRRAIRRDARVTAVLAPSDEARAGEGASDGDRWNAERLGALLPAARYRAFFGERLTLDFRGARDHFDAEVNASSTTARLARLRELVVRGERAGSTDRTAAALPQTSDAGTQPPAREKAQTATQAPEDSAAA